MASSPLQASFNAGEISEKLRGQFGSKIYEKGLDTCENFIPTPQGALLMRAGGQDIADLAVATKPRFIPFRVSGVAADYVLAFTNGKLEVFDRDTGAREQIRVAYQSHFDDTISYWVNSPSWPGAWAWNSGSGYGTMKKTASEALAILTGNPFLTIGFVAGHTYKVKVRYKMAAGTAMAAPLAVDHIVGGLVVSFVDLTASTSWATGEFEFVATAVDDQVGIGHFNPGEVWVDWVSIYDVSEALVDSIASPYSTAHLPLIQHDAELVRNRVWMAHPDVYPQLVSYEGDNLWSIRSPGFQGQPPEWTAGNYPASVEVGFQGRIWFGGNYTNPQTIWYSVSGNPFAFTVGSLAADAGSIIVSMKGRIKWLKGQHRLFAGAETTEHSISGSQVLITPIDINVEDQSAFGSGAVQGLHIGDQVVWVTRSLRTVRAMNYEQKEDSWLSTSLTFIAEGILGSSKIQEIHFAREPIPSLFIVADDGKLFAATYDRSVQVIAFYRVLLGGDATVATAAVVDGPAGAEFWYSPLRSGTYRVERIPMHEDGVDYLDSWREATADVDGVITGLAQFNGQIVTVKYLDDEGHSVTEEVEVAAGAATVEDAAGQTVVVGLSFTARAISLPLALKDKKGRAARIGVLINRSALPTLNGYLPQNDKLAENPQDLPQVLRSGKFTAAGEGADDEVKITIEQKRPFRTEVLALFSVTEA